jgi:hypothetical protein
MTDLFKCKDEMPPKYENTAIAMVREDTLPGTPILSGERFLPGRSVEHVERPRRGHAV